MASAVDVASKALALIGSEPITSLDPPDNTVRAKTIALQYNDARDATLRAHPWNFAIKRASLSADVAAPVWGYSQQFTLPNDNLRLLEVESSDRDLYPWRVEGGKVLSDLTAPINIRYVARIEDTELWDPLFIEAMAAHLGSLCAEKLTGLTSIVESTTALFQAKLSEARSKDGFEQTEETTDDTNDYSWLKIRYGF